MTGTLFSSRTISTTLYTPGESLTGTSRTPGAKRSLGTLRPIVLAGQILACVAMCGGRLRHLIIHGMGPVMGLQEQAVVRHDVID